MTTFSTTVDYKGRFSKLKASRAKKVSISLKRVQMMLLPDGVWGKVESAELQSVEDTPPVLTLALLGVA